MYILCDPAAKISGKIHKSLFYLKERGDKKVIIIVI